MQVVLVLVSVYLLAAIPFGYLIGRIGGVDVRVRGSGNIGATNLLRTRGKLAGAVTLLLDIGKGAAGVLLAAYLLPQLFWAPAAAGFAALVGHCFPIYLGFRGGKGVATALGAFLVLAPLATLLAVLLFIAILATTRLVAVGSAAAAVGFPAAVWALGDARLALAALPSAAVILWRHRENFDRIRRGVESRLGTAPEPGEKGR